MMTKASRYLPMAAAAAALAILTAMLHAQQPAAPRLSAEAACQTLVPASTGGPMPKDPNVVVVRWLGHTNYEIAYRDAVVLADGYYERVPRSHAIGVAPKDIKKADAILIGHAHFDHISDVPAVAKQTGAMVIGAAISSEYVRSKNVGDIQIKTVTGKGGEHLEVKSILVQPVLDHHNVIATTVPAGYLDKAATAMAAASLDKPMTPAEQAQLDEIRARGSRDPKIADEGTIGYLLTLGTSFHIMVADSPGPITDYQRQLVQQVPSVDVAMFSLVSMDAGIPPLVELAKLFKPGTLFIGHHDGSGTMNWASTFGAATAIRNAVPGTRTLEVPYRTPVCFSTTTKEMFVGQ
jgi:hypothetical protein